MVLRATTPSKLGAAVTKSRALASSAGSLCSTLAVGRDGLGGRGAAASASAKGRVAASLAVAVGATAPSEGRAAVAKGRAGTGSLARAALAVGGDGGAAVAAAVGRGVYDLAGLAVPVCFGLAHALAHGDAAVALGLEVLEHVASEVKSGLLVDIVGNGQTVTSGWAAGSGVEDALEVILGDLDVRELVVVVLRDVLACEIHTGEKIKKASRTVSKSK